jgi:hypothetical protein
MSSVVSRVELLMSSGLRLRDVLTEDGGALCVNICVYHECVGGWVRPGGRLARSSALEPL